MKRLFISFIGMVLLFSLQSAAQQPTQQDPSNFSKAVDFLPSTPNAMAVIKHEEIAVDKNTGVPHINIPLFSVKGRKLSSGISLGYASNGIKVDEVASQVGIGWSLEAGGVVTRTVRGAPDESNTRIEGPSTGIGIDSPSFHFLFNAGSNDNGFNGYDAEPDLFHFAVGGYSGSFVLDAGMHVMMVHPAPVKIDFDFNRTDWNFRITDPEGIVYYFGGSGATESTKKDQTCGKILNFYVPVAWHLIKILHPNGEVINLTYTASEYVYDNGMTQTQFYGFPGTPGGSCTNACTAPNNVDCYYQLHTQGVLLSSIVAPGVCQATFSYTDRLDYQYGKLLSRISLYDMVGNSNSLLKYWQLSYNQQAASTAYNHKPGSYQGYTPYLSSAIAKSSDSSIAMPYYFVYNDPGGRPFRLAYAQDHWGYFNGKNNTTLVPPPSDPTMVGNFPSATADRSASDQYAIKGMLSKVVYPTGGVDSLVYEDNVTTSGTGVSLRPVHHESTSVTGTGFSTSVVKSIYFPIDQLQTVTVDFQAIYNSAAGTLDPLHNKCRAEIHDPSGALVWSSVLVPGNSDEEFVGLSGAGTFELRLQADGAVSTSQGAVTFYPQNFSESYASNTVQGGLRIKEVLTANPGEKAMLKRYYYGAMSAPLVSTLLGGDVPLYNKNGSTRYVCSFAGVSGYGYCNFAAMYSSTLGKIYDFENAPVSYVTVTESYGGDNFQNGGIQTQYFSGADAQGILLYGANMLNAPKTNNSSYLNGKVKEELTFKNSGGSLVPISKKVYTYKIDGRKSGMVSGWAINHKYTDNFVPSWDCTGSDPSCASDIQRFMDGYDVTRYDVLSSWVYNDTVTEYFYSASGTLSNVTRFYYNDTSNYQLSSSETYDSKGNLLKTSYKYPHDYAGTPVYDSMTARNIVTPVVDVEKDRGSNRISLSHTSFLNWGNGNFQADSFRLAYGVGASRDIGVITKCDAAGNILEYKGLDGLITAIFWGYGNLYPVAKVVGAGYDQARGLLGVDTSVLNTYSGATLLAQLNVMRQNLSGAKVTTYDYKPQAGLLSITNLNNKAASSDYDTFLRLVDSRDQDGNIIKEIIYHYVTADAASTFTYYSNGLRTRTFPAPCLVGYSGSGFSYSVPAGRYFSTVSVDEANALADAELNSFGAPPGDLSGLSCSKIVP